MTNLYIIFDWVVRIIVIIIGFRLAYTGGVDETHGLIKRIIFVIIGLAAMYVAITNV